MNENGISAQSAISTYYACAIPADLSFPSYVSSDQTAKTITVSWPQPEDDGGCPILGYELYRSDGVSSDMTIKVDDLDNTNPSLTQHTVDL